MSVRAEWLRPGNRKRVFAPDLDVAEILVRWGPQI
jgi:hypothetical protein